MMGYVSLQEALLMDHVELAHKFVETQTMARSAIAVALNKDIKPEDAEKEIMKRYESQLASEMAE
jgi:hypothetical protein